MRRPAVVAQRLSAEPPWTHGPHEDKILGHLQNAPPSVMRTKRIVIVFFTDGSCAVVGSHLCCKRSDCFGDVGDNDDTTLFCSVTLERVFHSCHGRAIETLIYPESQFSPFFLPPFNSGEVVSAPKSKMLKK